MATYLYDCTHTVLSGLNHLPYRIRLPCFFFSFFVQCLFDYAPRLGFSPKARFRTRKPLRAGGYQSPVLPVAPPRHKIYIHNRQICSYGYQSLVLPIVIVFFFFCFVCAVFKLCAHICPVANGLKMPGSRNSLL